MVDNDTSRPSLKWALQGIADEQMQRRAWFGLGTEETSPDEAVNQFYGFDMDGLLASGRLSEPQKRSLTVLRKKMDAFCAATPEFLKAEDVVDDPRWGELRQLASELLLSVEITAEPESDSAKEPPNV